MKQLLQNMKTGKSRVEDVPVPSPREGQVLVKVEASLVSAGTERMVVEFAEKNLVGKARSRPDLVKQVVDKARREGLVNTAQAAFNRLDQPMALGYSSAGTIVALGSGIESFKVGHRVACAGGGYAVHAEIVSVPHQLVAKVPEARHSDGLEPDAASAEPVEGVGPVENGGIAALLHVVQNFLHARRYGAV